MQDRDAHVRKLMGAEVLADRVDVPTTAVQRLCQVAARLVPASGTAVSVVATDGIPHLVAASDGIEQPLNGLEQVTGAGPGLEAFATSLPVLVPDLDGVDPARWPGYPAGARHAGVRAVFAFPLQVGTVRLGFFALFRDATGPLAADELAWALTLADSAVRLLLEDRPVPGGDAETATTALPYHPEIFHAQGMVMMQLGVSLNEALLRLRAHAFSTDQALVEVARAVVARRLRLDRQPDDPGS
jgi:hypothetical protein